MRDDLSSPVPPPSWGLAALLATCAVAVTAGTWIDTFQLALSDEEVQYVLVAPFIVAWLAWARRKRAARMMVAHRWVGVLVMVLGWGAWSYGYRQSIPTFFRAGPILIVLGAVVSAVGVRVLDRFTPAVVALLFLVPITPTRRQIISAPMEAYAASWTQSLCQLLGMNVARSGNLLSVNGVSVEVAEACNGMRQVVTFWLVGYVLAFTQPLRWYVRAGVLILVPVLAIASNVMRLVPTVWVYSFGGGETAERFHDIAGWAMLVLAFGAVYFFLAVLDWASIPIRSVSATPSV